MFITKKRIRNVANYLKLFKSGQRLVIAVHYLPKFKKTLQKIGFTENLSIGERVLPRPLGRISMYNAEGKYMVNKNLPKETVYHQSEWKWNQWSGYKETEEKSKIVDVPYKRYPREFIFPPSEELMIVSGSQKEKIIISKALLNDVENYGDIKHVINLFLEIFGECQLLKDDLIPPFKAEVKRLNWEVLPTGKYPWKIFSPILKKNIKNIRKGNIPVIEHRIKTITNSEPNFVAIGKGGFSGYLIFGFPTIDLYILESTRIHNATYVLGKDWEKISRLTKSEILSNEYHKDRIIHREGWYDRIMSLISRKK